MPYDAGVSPEPRSRALRCAACGAEIPVRTFEAGRIVCPACGAERGLDGDLVGRLRAEAAAAGPPSSPRVEPDPERREPMRPVLLAAAALLLGLVAYLLYTW